MENFNGFCFVRRGGGAACVLENAADSRVRRQHLPMCGGAVPAARAPMGCAENNQRQACLYKSRINSFIVYNP